MTLGDVRCTTAAWGLFLGARGASLFGLGRANINGDSNNIMTLPHLNDTTLAAIFQTPSHLPAT